MTLAIPRHLTMPELEAALDVIRAAPKNGGVLEMIVRRPDLGHRDVVDEAELDPVVGLVGDSWSRRGSRRSADGGPHPQMQLNIMSTRVVSLVAQERAAGRSPAISCSSTWISARDNLPPGTRLPMGTAVIEVTAEPHTGCAKFVERFGVDAMKFVNSPEHTDLHLRGINAKVVQAGRIRVGDLLTKITGSEIAD